jgi:hypothetical protein
MIEGPFDPAGAEGPGHVLIDWRRRWMTVTPPVLSVPRMPGALARRRSQRETTPTKARSTIPARVGSKAMPNRRPNGTVSTHCRTGAWGIT